MYLINQRRKDFDSSLKKKKKVSFLSLGETASLFYLALNDIPLPHGVFQRSMALCKKVRFIFASKI